MPSLDQAYNRRWDGLNDPQRVGVGLVLTGLGALAGLIALGLVALSPGDQSAMQAAGITAGLGVPAMLLGIVVVLPASRQNRLGVLSGAALTVLGVAMFWFAYPSRWTRTDSSLAFETLILYAVGVAIALGFVFSALAAARIRNSPLGTVEVEVIREGETQTIEVSHDRYRELVSDGGDAKEVLKELKR